MTCRILNASTFVPFQANDFNHSANSLVNDSINIPGILNQRFDNSRAPIIVRSISFHNFARKAQRAGCCNNARVTQGHLSASSYHYPPTFIPARSHWFFRKRRNALPRGTKGKFWLGAGQSRPTSSPDSTRGATKQGERVRSVSALCVHFADLRRESVQFFKPATRFRSDRSDDRSPELAHAENCSADRIPLRSGVLHQRFSVLIGDIGAAAASKSDCPARHRSDITNVSARRSDLVPR